MRPPASRIGPLTADERAKLIATSPVSGQYDRAIDRESAFEILQKRAQEKVAAVEQQQAEQDSGSWTDYLSSTLGGGKRGSRQTVAETAVKSVVRTVSNSLGRAIVRGILGGFKR